jgi:hypothetical protein
MVCLTEEQVKAIEALGVSLEPASVEMRISPQLSRQAEPNSALVVELCDNSERDWDRLLEIMRVNLEPMQVRAEKVANKRIIAHIQGKNFEISDFNDPKREMYNIVNFRTNSAKESR